MTDTISRIMQIRNGMTTDADAEAIIEREIAALQPHGRSSPGTTRAALELAIQRALMDDDSYGVGCDDQDALEAAASFSATFIANAIADLPDGAATARAPKVRTSHHRNKEEAARLQELVDKRYASDAAQPVAATPSSAANMEEAIRTAETMLSEHIEEFHDFDYQPHEVPPELQQLRNIQHHLLGTLVELDPSVTSGHPAQSAQKWPSDGEMLDLLIAAGYDAEEVHPRCYRGFGWKTFTEKLKAYALSSTESK